jgi:hypothetical protein
VSTSCDCVFFLRELKIASHRHNVALVGDPKVMMDREIRKHGSQSSWSFGCAWAPRITGHPKIRCEAQDAHVGGDASLHDLVPTMSGLSVRFIDSSCPTG